MPLIIAGNHIGNPEDIPLRSLEIVKNADLLIFEEDRPARLVLKTAKIHRPYLKLNENYSEDALESAKECLINQQTVAYLSDQGMPSNADPGYQLVELALSLNASIKVIPGPCSISCAIAASPIKINKYNYEGFLKRSPRDRKAQLKSISRSKIPTVILDTPYRLIPLLEECKEIFTNPESRLLISLEIGNSNQQYIFGSANEVQQKTKDIKKQNFVLIIFP